MYIPLAALSLWPCTFSCASSFERRRHKDSDLQTHTYAATQDFLSFETVTQVMKVNQDENEKRKPHGSSAVFRVCVCLSQSQQNA